MQSPPKRYVARHGHSVPRGAITALRTAQAWACRCPSASAPPRLSNRTLRCMSLHHSFALSSQPPSTRPHFMTFKLYRAPELARVFFPHLSAQHIRLISPKVGSCPASLWTAWCFHVCYRCPSLFAGFCFGVFVFGHYWAVALSRPFAVLHFILSGCFRETIL